MDQKEKLIGATERLLCSQGLGCVTTRDIARAAKVAEGALYHHFHDKAELILSVVLHQLGDFPEVLQSLPLQVGQNTVQKNLQRVLESGVRLSSPDRAARMLAFRGPGAAWARAQHDA